jgi:hypothetical protein
VTDGHALAADPAEIKEPYLNRCSDKGSLLSSLQAPQRRVCPPAVTAGLAAGAECHAALRKKMRTMLQRPE